ncbi:unnamed protein product [Rotaria sp. Silwood2]|nr:unnamed protein product [Rotaria sp. Silwood2]CAF2937447.1 unnamed protein product [Rotaria sp. Silwood2]CAF4057111.1 unnamed protein product [Rotaria sp. Silwood2]CAF4106559.1 unnamed protein product [Rotaria sp. Silwood2]
MFTQSYALPSATSSSSITTSGNPPVKTKRKYTKRPHRSAVEQKLSQCLNTSAKSIFSNYRLSLPLPSKIDSFKKPDKYKFPVDLVRSSNFTSLSPANSRILSNSPSTMIYNESKSLNVPQPLSLYSTTNVFERYPTLEQRLPHQKFGLEKKTTNNCFTSNLVYNLPYDLTVPEQHHCMLTPNPLFINASSRINSPLLPESNTSFPSVSFSTNIEKASKKEGDLQTPQVSQNSTANRLMEDKNLLPIHSIMETPILKRHLEKQSKIDNHQTKTLIRRIKQRNKLAILKFMIRKRKKQQQVLKKSISAIPIEKLVEQTIDIKAPKPIPLETMPPDIIALNLKVTFNTAQKLESISLYYQQRHKPEIKREPSFVAANNTVNKLDLLIEAINFIETCNGNLKLTLESIE